MVLQAYGFKFALSERDFKRLDKIRFGFVGEFGYLMLTYAPFLAFLAENGGKSIKTVGGAGSSPFFYFSANHIEHPDILQSNSWGNPKAALKLRKLVPRAEKIFVPLNRTARRIDFNPVGPRWDVPHIHVDFSNADSYKKLTLGEQKKGEGHAWLSGIGSYAVMTVKSHFSWAGSKVKNSYSAEEARAIGEWASAHGHKVVVLRPPVPSIPGEEEDYIDTELEAVLSELPFVDSNDVFLATTNLGERNSFQIELLKRAVHVFAAQGGNGILAAICNPRVTVVMRVGLDWIDFDSLAKKYNHSIEVVYDVRQSALMRY